MYLEEGSLLQPMTGSTISKKIEEIQSDESFVKELESALEQGEKEKQSAEEINSIVEKIILSKAAEKGVDITKEELDSFSIEKEDNELAAVSGGGAAAACGAGAGTQALICGVGGFLTAGASAIASLVTGGGIAIASATAS